MSLLDDRIAQYYSKLGVEPVKIPDDEIINPGAKTVGSIVSKIKRNVEMFGNPDFTVDKISDMARCSIMFDSYGQMPGFLLQMKKLIPETTGYISRFDNGYRGIHLNFSIEGINVEIQLSTKEAWKVNQATEVGYTKWRDFNQKLELDEILKLQQEIKEMEVAGMDEIDDNFVATLKQKKELLLTKKIGYLDKVERFKQYNKESQNLYEFLHNGPEKSDFYEYEDDIEAILQSFTIKGKDRVVKLPPSLTRKFDTKDGLVDEAQATEIAKGLYEITSLTQEILINQVKKAKEISQNESSNLAPEDELSIKKLKEAKAVYDNIIEQKLDGKTRSQNVKKICFQRAKIVVEAFKRTNDYNRDAKTIIADFVNDLIAKDQYKNSIYDIDVLVDGIKKTKEADSKTITI